MKERISRRDVLGYLVGIAALGTAGGLIKDWNAKEKKPKEENKELHKKSQTRGDSKESESVEIIDNIEINDNGIYLEYTGRFEGRCRRVYDARPNDPVVFERTIGIGHYLDRGNSRRTFREVFGDEINYNHIYSGRAELTDEQIDRLFEHDIERYVDRTRELILGFDDLPDYLRVALVDMSYRGDLGDSPRTRRLMNGGRWREAADEHINRAEYRNAFRNGMNGLRIRMDSNRNRILRYVEELER